MTPKTGRCLCGAVAFTARVSETIQACHCTQCQRWTGGGPLYAVRVEDLEITTEDPPLHTFRRVRHAGHRRDLRRLPPRMDAPIEGASQSTEAQELEKLRAWQASQDR